MALPDEDIYPTATGAALKTVKAHEKPAGVILYSGWFCPFVQRVWMALEEKEIPYQYKEENPYKKDEEFLKISPRGLVPAIVVDGHPIFESLVILEFLEDAYPDKKPLMPKDPIERAHVRIAIDHISKAVVPNFFKLLQAQEKEAQDSARSALEDAFIAFLHRVRGPYLLGQELSLADISLAPFIARLYLLEEHRGFTLHKTDLELKGWIEAIQKQESYQNTLSDREHYEKIFSRYLNNTAQSEVAKATRSGSGLP